MVGDPYGKCPLDLTSDSIRLISIDSQLSSDGLLCCSLITVKFAQRPRYEALSYRWGDDTKTWKILVDDTEFRVTENLYDALEYMRQHPRKVPIWIDAISINQDDLTEKTRQLRIMPHIYRRAVTVVVFLGISHATASGGTPDSITNDPYWKRLWIIQEIAKARDIVVLLHDVMSWDDFISFYGQEAGGPAKVNELRKSQHSNNSSLLHLVEKYSEALCRDPRDKVYGLVGLSSDGQGFPIDYAKSTRDVWADTMAFMGKQGLLKAEDNKLHIEFGIKLWKWLGSPTGFKGVLQFDNLADDEALHDWRVSGGGDIPHVRLVADVLGTVFALGPSSTELAQSLDLSDRWEQELQRVFSTERDAAFAENQLIMNAILDNDDPRLSQWQAVEITKVKFYGPLTCGYMLHTPGREMSSQYKSAWQHTTKTPDEPRFVLIKEAFHKDETWTKIALVPPSVKIGDHVCSLPNTPTKRFIVRPEHCRDHRESLYSIGTVFMNVHGTAVLLGETPGHTAHNRLQISMSGSALFALMFD